MTIFLIVSATIHTQFVASPLMDNVVRSGHWGVHSKHRFLLSMDEAGEGKSLRDLVKQDRMLRRGGLGAGALCVLAAAGAGSNAGIIDAKLLLSTVAGGTLIAAGSTILSYASNEESRPPCPVTSFEVLRSPGKGQGLFATAAIEKGAFLFDYEGEILDEDAFFDRYPDGDGRYIACITDNLYIDGADPSQSNVARWMNHAPPESANVVWRKQKLGPRKAMHFYATTAIQPGEELCFDYKEDYWLAAKEQPI